MSAHQWTPTCIPWWVPYVNRVRFEVRCDECGQERTCDVEVEDSTLDGTCDPEAAP